jgi:uncharacterized protein YkwD
MLAKGIATALLVGALGALAPATASAFCENQGKTPSELTPQQAADSVVCLINERRAAHGVGALGSDARLASAARGHSAAMDARNFFAHGDFQGRIARSGYLAGASSWAIAEDLRWGRAGRGSPKVAVAAWMASPPHREAMLSGRYRDLGVGVAIGSPTRGGDANSAIYTADFGVRS